MDFATQPISYSLNGGLGKLCIFGCKKQKAANAAKVAAVEADKVQAASIESMKANNAETAKVNAELIASKDAEAQKKKMMIIYIGGGALALLAIGYFITHKK